MSASTQKRKKDKRLKEKPGLNVSPCQHKTIKQSVWEQRAKTLSRHKKRKSQRLHQSLTRWAESSQCSCWMPCLSPTWQSHRVWDSRSAVTRWRPRFQRAAAGASCPGGEGQTPAPSGRYLGYGGSPASWAYGGTSSDPEETSPTKQHSSIKRVEKTLWAMWSLLHMCSNVLFTAHLFLHVGLSAHLLM